MGVINAQIVINNGAVQTVIQPIIPSITIGASAFVGGSAYTASNGITLTGTNFTLGGVLLSNTTITANGLFLSISGDGTGRFLNSFQLDGSNFSSLASKYNQFNFTTNFNSVASGTTSINISSAQASLAAGSSGITNSIALDPAAGTIITANSLLITSANGTFGGAKYNADYSANYTNRTLADWGTILAAKTFTGKQTFVQTTTTAPLKLGGFATDPSVPTESELEYNSSSKTIKYYDGTSWITLLGGTSSAWLLGSGGTLTGANTITGTTSNTIKFVFNSLGTTQTDGAGLWLQNSTVATSGNQQSSPAVTFDSQGWGNTLGTSQSVKIIQDVLPLQSAAPSAIWRLRNSVNGSAYQDAMTLQTSPTFTQLNIFGIINSAANTMQLAVTGTVRMSIDNGTGNVLIGNGAGNNGRLYVLQTALSSAWLSILRLDGGAHTSITAATENIDVDFNLARNVQWLAGTVATQRQVYVRGVTLTGASATATFTSAYSLYVDPPIAGTNAVITTPYAAGFNGKVAFTTTSAFAAFTFGQTSITPSTLSDGDMWFNFSTGALAFRVSGGTSSIFRAPSNQINTNAIVYSVGTNGGSQTVPQFTYDSFTLTVGSNVAATSGSHSALVVNGAAHTSQTASELLDVNFNLARTLQFAGSTGFATQRAFRIQAPTYAFVSATGTITNAYTGYIDGGPVAGTNAVLTNTWALGLGGALQLFAGTTTMPPLVFQSGTNSSTIINGAVEFNGTHATIAIGGVRYQLDQQVSASGWLVTGTTTITGNTNQTGAFTETFNLNSVVITQNNQSGTIPTGFVFNGGTHTALTASTQAYDINFAISRIVQFATGALTSQHAITVGSPIYAFVGASTITEAATFEIVGAPTTGTNASITNSHALIINPSAGSTSTTNSYGLTVNASTGATNNYSAQFKGGIGVVFTQTAQSATHNFIDITQAAHTGGSVKGFVFTGGSSTGLAGTSVDVRFALSRTVQFATGTYSAINAVLIDNPTWSFVGASTVTDANLINISASPVSSTNATFTNASALYIGTINVGSGVTNSYGISVNAQSGATNNYSARFLGGSVGILTAAPVSSMEIAGSYGDAIATLSANTTLDATHATVLVDATGANRTITLPTTTTTRRIYRVVKKDSSANTVTISTTAGGNKVISTQYAGFCVQYDGTSWYIIGSF